MGVALSVCTHARAAACCAFHTTRRRRWRCPTAERLRRATQLRGGRGPCRWQCNTSMLPGTKSAKASVHQQSRPARRDFWPRIVAMATWDYGRPGSSLSPVLHAWSGLVFAGLAWSGRETPERRKICRVCYKFGSMDPGPLCWQPLFGAIRPAEKSWQMYPGPKIERRIRFWSSQRP